MKGTKDGEKGKKILELDYSNMRINRGTQQRNATMILFLAIRKYNGFDFFPSLCDKNALANAFSSATSHTPWSSLPEAS